MKNAIKQIAKVYPNIIINGVNYDDVKVPRHWKLSERHAMDIQEKIKILSTSYCILWMTLNYKYYSIFINIKKKIY